MLQFLQPIWLWAGSAAIVPVIIHLWNVQSGKTRKVGSIRLYNEAAKSGSRKRRLTEWWLLLLRCLLLISLAVLLAKPVWLKPQESKEKGWLLIPENEVQMAYRQQKAPIDSLLREGYHFHYFESEFREEKMEEALQNVLSDDTATRFNYWSLMKELDQMVPPGIPVHLFSDNQLKHFAGARPSVSFPLQWHIVSGEDTASEWIQNAWQIGKDSLRIIEARSRWNGTQYSAQNLSYNGTNQRFETSERNGKKYVRYKKASDNIAIDTSALRIILYAKGDAKDADYISAALSAMQAFTKQNITVSKISRPEAILPYYDWLFWLSDEKIPDSLLKNHVWLYQKGKTINSHSRLLFREAILFENRGSIPVYQLTKDSLQPGEKMVWATTSGEPVLTKQNNGSEVYRFYSRFQPQWNDLVWSAHFPQILYAVVSGAEKDNGFLNKNEERLLDASQITPVGLPEKEKQHQKRIISEDLSKPAWTLIFALLLLERLISLQRKMKTS